LHPWGEGRRQLLAVINEEEKREEQVALALPAAIISQT
jgi:hypothetical protein